MGKSAAKSSTGTGTAVLLGSAGAALASGAGGTTITPCPANDTSFYCTLTRWVNIIKMLIFILIVILVIVFILWYLRSRSGRSR